jgi:hypothetical protein
VVLFSHYPILGDAALPSHTLWNAEAVLEVIDRYEGVVVAHMNGHYHAGGYAERKSVHHYTMKGIVEAPKDSNCYGVMDVYKEKMVLRGFGHVSNQTFLIKEFV